MRRRFIAAGLGVGGVLAALGASSGVAQAATVTPRAAAIITGRTAQVAAGEIVTRMYAPASNTCIDVWGGTTDINQNIGTAPCQNTQEQQFTLIPVPVSGFSHTYRILNAASNLCLAPFRFEVRQGDCLHPIVQNQDVWAFLPAGAAHQYVLTNYLGTGQGRCMALHPTSPPSADWSIWRDFCDTGNSSQIFEIPDLP
ncbi:RICIN domain-containing protein [Actinoallomurus rhizosphaericola]|uniref:RICIN domain-containing protein n=1 Tax=Actinoallomurus rhizosphaericola TaxID=2952536 RepID=UPI002092B4A2|nr:RICIN domain-containing protein [Actinoallomurus rhizosphaericola]MCO5999347.1 RICIN domain-containing protein [Actinoallomurus rhizosphaericola]